MSLPATESFAAGAGNLPSPPWTQAALAAQRLNTDGTGLGKASATSASDVIAFWNNDAFTADQYSKSVYKAGASSGANYFNLYVRCLGTGVAFRGYAFTTDGVNGLGHSELGIYTAGVYTEKTFFNCPVTANDLFEIRAVGTLITAYRNGALLGSFTDATYNDGAPGVGVFNSGTNTLTLDDWEGGNVAAPSRLARIMAPQQRMCA